MSTPRPEAVAAATWWADRITRPITQQWGNDNPRFEAAVLHAQAAMQQRFTEPQIDTFRAVLATEIDARLSAGRLSTGGAAGPWIACDYGPDPILADAAAEAGFFLGMNDVPWKTTMHVNLGIVTVSEGYCADYVTVWSADKADAS